MATLPTGPYAAAGNGDRALVFPLFRRAQSHHGVDSFYPRDQLQNTCLKVRASTNSGEHKHLI